MEINFSELRKKYEEIKETDNRLKKEFETVLKSLNNIASECQNIREEWYSIEANIPYPSEEYKLFREEFSDVYLGYWLPSEYNC